MDESKGVKDSNKGFVVSRYYKQRNGLPAYVVRIAGGSLHGGAWVHDRGWVQTSWGLGGEFYPGCGAEEKDLVELWVGPLAVTLPPPSDDEDRKAMEAVLQPEVTVNHEGLVKAGLIEPSVALKALTEGYAAQLRCPTETPKTPAAVLLAMVKGISELARPDPDGVLATVISCAVAESPAKASMRVVLTTYQTFRVTVEEIVADEAAVDG